MGGMPMGSDLTTGAGRRSLASCSAAELSSNMGIGTAEDSNHGQWPDCCEPGNLLTVPGI